jgi:DNA-directed RNA polymerase subunit M
MEFCPNCGAIMLPKDGVLKCNSCDYSADSQDDESYKVQGTIDEHETVQNLGKVEDMRSTINETCPECGHTEAYYELKQTRSADEAPTRFFTCAKCNHKWREYS